jgi:exoribonuclease R
MATRPRAQKLQARVETVELAAELGRVLNQARKDRGSLDFDLPEPELQLDPLGVIENITSNPRLFAMRMIEEFMLVANEAVAKRTLEQKGSPRSIASTSRPIRTGSRSIVELVRTFGYTSPPISSIPRARTSSASCVRWKAVPKSVSSPI